VENLIKTTQDVACLLESSLDAISLRPGAISSINSHSLCSTGLVPATRLEQKMALAGLEARVGWARAALLAAGTPLKVPSYPLPIEERTQEQTLAKA